MSIVNILSWILCGLVVGLCARFFVPGRQSMSLPMTVLLGIVGSIVGGFLYALMWGVSSEPFSMADHTWPGWIVAILGAMLVVWFYPYFFPRRWWQ